MDSKQTEDREVRVIAGIEVVGTPGAFVRAGALTLAFLEEQGARAAVGEASSED